MEQSGPKWRSIVDDIADRVRSGDLPVGARLPSLHAMAGSYGVSVPTVQRAVRVLKAAGIVRGVPGVSVVVVGVPGPVVPVEGLPSLAELAADVAELQRWRAEHERGHGV